jgi:hypothetical protein
MKRLAGIGQLMQEWRINGFVVFEDLIPLETIDQIRQAWAPIRNAGIEQQGNPGMRVNSVIIFACLLKVRLLMKKSSSTRHWLNFLSAYRDQIMSSSRYLSVSASCSQTMQARKG